MVRQAKSHFRSSVASRPVRDVRPRAKFHDPRCFGGRYSSLSHRAVGKPSCLTSASYRVRAVAPTRCKNIPPHFLAAARDPQSVLEISVLERYVVIRVPKKSQKRITLAPSDGTCPPSSEDHFKGGRASAGRSCAWPMSSDRGCQSLHSPASSPKSLRGERLIWTWGRW
jgi:hypothetical protein